MALGDLAVEALRGVLRMVGRFVGYVVIELLIQGTGHAVLKALRPGREVGDFESAAVGLLLWAMALGGLWWYLSSAG